MKRTHAPQLADILPPEGVIDMACTEFADDPEQFHAYASFAGRVDAYLSCRGLRGWAALDVKPFIAHSGRTPSEAGTLCCMLATVLPWMVRARDISRLDATRKFVALLKACPEDAQARACIERAREQLAQTDASVAAELRH